MATQILAVPQHARQSEYRLPEAARRALVVSNRQIPADKLAEIERQRIAFADLNGGCAFGQQDAGFSPPPPPTAN